MRAYSDALLLTSCPNLLDILLKFFAISLLKVRLFDLGLQISKCRPCCTAFMVLAGLPKFGEIVFDPLLLIVCYVAVSEATLKVGTKLLDQRRVDPLLRERRAGEKQESQS